MCYALQDSDIFMNKDILLSVHHKAKIPWPFVDELSTPMQPTLPIDRHSYYSEKIMYGTTRVTIKD
jgi:hypothetical protein